MDIKSIGLDEMLKAREERAEAQARLTAMCEKPLISFSMNIPGEIKSTPLIEMAFKYGLSKLDEALGDDAVSREVSYEATGPFALIVCDRDSEELKSLAVAIEESCPIGRLFDMDVIGVDGKKLSRDGNSQRRCIVCGGPAAACARSRAHGLLAVNSAVKKLLVNYSSNALADMAVQALIDEAELTPKPGLVDSANNGAHKDMNLRMLKDSAAVLRPFFAYFAGFEQKGELSLIHLQKQGILAEKAMLEATGGVNTHKGAIFAFGVFLAAYGLYLANGGDAFENCKHIVGELRGLGAASHEAATHGGIVAARYGQGGAMDEAALGFPTARIGARALFESRGDAIFAMLCILEIVQDTNVLYRGGPLALDYIHAEARAIKKLPPEKREAALVLMDRECIRRNISPGGAADMLALAMLMYALNCH